jgi:cobalt-zinc-cadmium efflux system outer membrane protein
MSASFEAGAGMRRFRVEKFFISLSLTLWCPGILTAAAAPQTGQTAQGELLRLDPLVVELRAANPELQVARKRYEAALARPAQESALPDPRITVGWTSVGWPYPGAGLGSEATSNIGVQVAQEIPFPGKRALKGGIAEKEAQSVAQAYRITELRLIAQLKQRFYELRFAYEAIDLLSRNQQVLQQLAKVAEARYATGKATQQDIIKAGVEVLILDNRLILLEQKKLSLGTEINALLNRAPEADLARPEPAPALPVLESFEALRARALESSPLLLAQRAVIDGRQLGVQSAQRAYYPDFDLMTGYYNMGSLKPMWEFKVQINVPLFAGRKQRYGLEEAGAGLAEAQRTYRNEQQMLLARLRDRHLAAGAALKLMDLYAHQVVPQSELALQSSLTGYETGSADFLTVLANFTTIREYQMSYREQQSEYLKALAGMEELIGDHRSSVPDPAPSGSEVRR